MMAVYCTRSRSRSEANVRQCTFHFQVTDRQPRNKTPDNSAVHLSTEPELQNYLEARLCLSTSTLHPPRRRSLRGALRMVGRLNG